MAVLQEAGRIALAKAVAAQTIHIAWGSGLAAWDAAPVAEPTNATVLKAEIGRRKVTDVQYVKPDSKGTIELPNGSKYSVSATPTTYLMLRCTFDFADAAGQTIREIGVFFGTVVDAAVPAGQLYVTAAQVKTKGELYSLEYRPASVRSGSVRQVEEIILPF